MQSPFNKDIFEGSELIEYKEFLESTFDEDLFEEFTEDKDESILEDEEYYEDWRTVCDFIDGCSDDVEDKTFIHTSYMRNYLEDYVSCYDLKSIPEFIKDHINWESLYDSLESEYSTYDDYYYY